MSATVSGGRIYGTAEKIVVLEWPTRFSRGIRTYFFTTSVVA